jgi:TATA-binding protein-associated factor
VIDYSQSTIGRRTSTSDVGNGSGSSHWVKQEVKSAEEDSFSVTAQPQDANRIVIEHKAPPVSALASLVASPEISNVWPFEGLTEILTLDLGDSAWETRHGAAISLREIMGIHGRGAGRLVHLNILENDKRNAEYLEDLALRCICVFLLDRFGDFVSDQVVAPIRESVAQLLGAILVHMSKSAVLRIFRLLRRLVMQSDFLEFGPIWEVCHGGMLGIKYLVAVREDIFLAEPEVLDGVFECVLHGLGNHDDDVRAVAAATLVPVAEQFVSLRPSLVQTLIDTLWISLEELRDDLSASTGSVMDLLAKLFSFPSVLEMIMANAASDEEKSFAVLIPRLFPFLRHTIRGVRFAVLRALRTFLSIKQERGTDWISSKALRLIFQNIIFEQVEEIRELSLTVWTELISSVPAAELRSTVRNCMLPMTSLLFTPIGTSQTHIPLDSTLIIRPSGQTMVPGSKSSISSGQKGKTKAKEDWSMMQNRMHNLDGPTIRGDINLVGEEVMIKTRVTGAKALGRLIAAWPTEVHPYQHDLLTYRSFRWNFVTF